MMNKEIREILENVMYWETCPADYKEKIKNYLSSEPQQQALNIPVVSGSYSIDFGKHCKAKIQIENGEPKVEAAMNGWGDGISLSDITIEKLYYR